jgi:nicotinamidase-related amidase
VQSLLKASLAKGIPIIYTTTAFCVFFDMGAFPVKAPSWSDLILGTPATDIDDKIAPEPGVDTLIAKKRPSAFASTHLGRILRAGNIDTLICTSVTLAGCVRYTVEDALGAGFRTVVVRQCVGDRVPAAVEWNLFDIDMKYSDVEPLTRVLAYLGELAPVSEAAKTMETAQLRRRAIRAPGQRP